MVFWTLLLPVGKSRKVTLERTYARSDPNGQLHCEVTAYFSPVALVLAEEFDTRPCEKPEWPGLVLLLGDEGPWSVLFPENKE